MEARAISIKSNARWQWHQRSGINQQREKKARRNNKHGISINSNRQYRRSA